MTVTFDEATTLQPRGSGAFDLELRREFAVGGAKPNGGYLLAFLGRAALAAAREAGSAHQHAIAASAQYLASPDLGPARIPTQVLRVGESVTQVAADIENEGNPGVRAQITLATLPDGGEPYWGAIAPVALSPIEECRPSRFTGDRSITLAFDPDAGFTMSPDGLNVSSGSKFRAWFRDEHRDRIDTVELLYAADALPPATATVVRGGWVPTLDITVYIRAIPAPGPLRIRFRVQLIRDGFADEICEAWDTAGRLVPQSTQLAALRHPALRSDE